MARTAEKVESLVDEDASMADAIATVRDVAESNGGVVTWSDVSDHLTSGQWGRLIEKGILEGNDDGDGFQLADADAVDEGLDDETTFSAAPSTDTDEDEDDDEGSSWSTYDKAAGVLAMALMAGYYVTSVRDIVGGAIDAVLGPLNAALPFYAVILSIAMMTGLYSTLLQANLTDMEKMGEYQERMQEIQDKRKAAKERGDDEALDRIQEEQMEAMGDQLGMMKEQFRPMVWIFLLTIPFFLWMYWKISGDLGSAQMIMPIVGQKGWAEGVLGPMQGWIVWYFLCSMGFTQLIRKSLNLQTTPQTS